jgi:hypothetical protein
MKMEDRVFRNVGVYNSDVEKLPRRKHTTFRKWRKFEIKKSSTDLVYSNCKTIQQTLLPSPNCMTTRTIETCQLHVEIHGRMILFHLRHVCTYCLKFSCCTRIIQTINQNLLGVIISKNSLFYKIKLIFQ